MKRLALLIVLLATSAYAQTACLQSPTGYYTCGGAVIVTDNNALPTPAANALTVDANSGTISPMPTPVAGACKFFDMDASGTTTCVLTNGTTLMHIPPTGAELPRIAISTQTGTPYSVGATADEVVLCDATAAAIVINLPAAATAAAGRRYMVKKIDATGHACTVTPNGAEKIDGQSSFAITGANSSFSFVTNATAWYVY